MRQPCCVWYISQLLAICHSTLQMLTNIENRLEELFEEIESLPPEKVEAAEKVNNNYCHV